MCPQVQDTAGKELNSRDQYRSDDTPYDQRYFCFQFFVHIGDEQKAEAAQKKHSPVGMLSPKQFQNHIHTATTAKQQ